MGGAIEVWSEKLKGTKFHFTVRCSYVSEEEKIRIQIRLNSKPKTCDNTDFKKNLQGKSILVISPLFSTTD